MRKISYRGLVCMCLCIIGGRRELLFYFGGGRVVNIIIYHRTCFKLCGLVFMFYTLTVFAFVTVTVDKAHIHNTVFPRNLAAARFNFKVLYHAATIRRRLDFKGGVYRDRHARTQLQ